MVSVCFLPLHEVADHLLAVAARAPVADVYPAGLARGGGLPDELVKLEVVHHPGEPFPARLGVRDEDVGSAAARVVRGFHAPDGGVELRRAVAAVDADGVAEMGPQRLQDVEAELLEVADDFLEVRTDILLNDMIPSEQVSTKRQKRIHSR